MKTEKVTIPFLKAFDDRKFKKGIMPLSCSNFVQLEVIFIGIVNVI